ncbi:MAG TPA: hypothetical protein VF930_11290 [Stellaceae bacterium]|jgi:hypothetical protein
MGDKEFIEETSSPSGEAELLAKPASEPAAGVSKTLAGADAGTIETTAAVVAPKLAAAADTTTAAGKRGFASGDAGDTDDLLAEPAQDASSVSRFTLFAAAIALAAALGAMIGALTAYGLARPAGTAVAADAMSVEDIQALKENVVQARLELAALKVSIDSASRSAAAQLTRIGERIERLERAQTDPGKLGKALDALDRVSRAEAAAPPKDATGSIVPPMNQPGKLEGWVVRDVRRGTALIEGRMGLIEVDQGDVVPGLGRVDAIRKQDGRWVVVTSKGLIMPPR